MNEIEHAIMTLFKDCKIGDIVMDGKMIGLQEKFPNLLAQYLSMHVQALIKKDMIERALIGYKLKPRGYQYLHP